MKPLSLGQIASWSAGELRQGSPERCVTRVCTDSRNLQPGDLFVALKGEHFDGHTFAGQAGEKGAIAVMVENGFPAAGLPPSLGVIAVADTLKGLQQLAAAYRGSLKVKVVGVTGSNGKTSCKELAAAALGARYHVYKTQGNLNNHIGVPLSLLSLQEGHEFAVIEMGMSHAGEIRRLAEIARPDHALVTQVGWAHIEFFDSREGIAAEKGELVRALPKNGLAVLNADDVRVAAMAGWTLGRPVLAGESAEADYRISAAKPRDEGMEFGLQPRGGAPIPLWVPRRGRHMVQNAALAAALALECGVDAEGVRGGLAAAVFPAGRLALEAYRGGWLVDDTYNANPDSMLAGLRTLLDLPGEGRAVALLGSMGELGSQSERLHEELGREAAGLGLGLLFAYGRFAESLAKGGREGGLGAGASRAFASHELLARAYLESARAGDRILVKGSRSAGMENVVAFLKKAERN
jgi:UDP-N-acetylmuramoyl-tripeptide--D-alanyl-D-alanine ligase